jgi:hypothetical protein
MRKKAAYVYGMLLFAKWNLQIFDFTGKNGAARED